MGYSQKFIGSLTFADAHCLEEGLDAFAASVSESEQTFVRIDDMDREGLTLAIEVDSYGPASMWDPTMIRLGALAGFAVEGEIECTFVGDSAEIETIASDGVSEMGEPGPLHHRWDVFFAARAGDAAALRALAGAGAVLDARYEDLSTLHLASEHAEDDAVCMLLDAGVPVDVVSKDGRSALFRATPRSAEALLAAGADPHRIDANGRSVIATMVMLGREPVVRMLLAAGATLPPGEYERIAASCARHGLLDLARTFEASAPAFGAVLAAEPVMEAAITGRDAVFVDFLLEHGAALPTDFLGKAIAAGAIALVESALRAPDAIAACGSSSERKDAMCVAAREGHVDVMQLLADRGVPIHPATPGDTCPFHQAVVGRSANRVAAVDWLLARGVALDARSADGRNAVAYVIVATSSPEFLMTLVERGADPAEVRSEDLANVDFEKFQRLLAAWQAKRVAHIST